jgi:enoyl-CoA hydratase
MSKVITSRKGDVATVMINRPEVRNAVDNETAAQLADAFRDFDRDKTARVALFAGVGGTFCAGADLKEMAFGDRRRRWHESSDGPMGPTRLQLTKPVIGAIEGHAVAGGLELALWCDMRIVDSKSVFGVFSRRWGVPLLDGGTVRLPRLIGLAHAMDMLLTGRPVAGEEAHRIGLASRLVSDGEVLAAAEKLASDIARFPQSALQYDRTSAYAQWGLGLEAALAAEFEAGKTAPEAEAGAARFVSGAGRHGSFERI